MALTGKSKVTQILRQDRREIRALRLDPHIIATEETLSALEDLEHITDDGEMGQSPIGQILKTVFDPDSDQKLLNLVQRRR